MSVELLHDATGDRKYLCDAVQEERWNGWATPGWSDPDSLAAVLVAIDPDLIVGVVTLHFAKDGGKPASKSSLSIRRPGEDIELIEPDKHGMFWVYGWTFEIAAEVEEHYRA